MQFGMRGLLMMATRAATGIPHALLGFGSTTAPARADLGIDACVGQHSPQFQNLTGEVASEMSYEALLGHYHRPVHTPRLLKRCRLRCSIDIVACQHTYENWGQPDAACMCILTSMHTCPAGGNEHRCTLHMRDRHMSVIDC